MSGVRIGVARDPAFDLAPDVVLDGLRALGAEVVLFSPLQDGALPDALDGLWLCGSTTERHLTELATHPRLREAVRAHAAAGRPILAACGGLTWLGEGLYDLDGAAHPGCGVLPIQVQLLDAPRTRPGDVETRVPTCLGPAGTRLVGRYLQRVDMVFDPDTTPAFDGGWVDGSVLATWLFVDVERSPGVLRSFVEACGA